MKVFIIRHGETLGQGKTISLTTKGKEQAHNTGLWLENFFKDNNINKNNVILKYSPLKRAQETMEIINNIVNVNSSCVELLREQEYGLFDSLTIEEQQSKYMELYDDFYRKKLIYGRFYAKYPGGESPKEVCERLSSLIFKVKEESKINNVVIISHATTIKCFVMKWFNYDVNVWYKNEPIPSNCSVRLIDINNDFGYIYEP